MYRRTSAEAYGACPRHENRRYEKQSANENRISFGFKVRIPGKTTPYSITFVVTLANAYVPYVSVKRRLRNLEFSYEPYSGTTTTVRLVNFVTDDSRPLYSRAENRTSAGRAYVFVSNRGPRRKRYLKKKNVANENQPRRTVGARRFFTNALTSDITRDIPTGTVVRNVFLFFRA